MYQWIKQVWVWSLVCCLAALPLSAQPAVKLGVDVLAESEFEALRGQRVGLVANPASVAGDLTSTVDVLMQGAKDGHFTFVALYGPEHGVYGDEYAGDKIDDRVDPRTGLPARSLYGKTRKPSPEMLADIDTLVFDLQDIGSRSYTYISTMTLCLEACIEQGKRFVILDRPNPLGGERIEGPGITPQFQSFISQIDVPYVHGMTMGELALIERDRIDPDYDGLVIVKMQGWTRDMNWEDTGLNWVPTSPHIPFASSCAAYAATGVLGELGIASNGVGYTLPFEVVGMPKIDGDALAAKLNTLNLKGVDFRPARFKPFYATHEGEVCGGVQLYLDPDAEANFYEINFILIDALGLCPRLKDHKKVSGFDKANGTDATRLALAGDVNPTGLFRQWRSYSRAFRQAREQFLLYD